MSDWSSMLISVQYPPYANFPRASKLPDSESDPTPTTNPQDQDYWPQDSLHDAARQVVGGIKGLVPNARRTLREAAERADAAPTGRPASDAAVGRALRIGP